jgi:hypothetical protein
MDSSTAIIDLKGGEKNTNDLVNNILKELEIDDKDEDNNTSRPRASNIDTDLFSLSTNASKEKQIEHSGTKWYENVEYIFEISKLSLLVITIYFVVHNSFFTNGLKKTNISLLQEDNTFIVKLIKAIIMGILVKCGHTFI